MRRRVYNIRLMKTNSWTVGLDLGDRRHYVCVLNEAGDVVAEEAIVNTREVLTAFGARYPGATFVMETGTHSPWVSRLLAALGHPVIVANARKLFVAPPAYGGHPCSSPSASLRAAPAGATISALPRSVRAISQSQTKSDREDAQAGNKSAVRA